MPAALARPHPASFRDPAGFVFERDGTLYRQVNAVGAADYERLMDSGLYDALVARGLLVAHEETDAEPAVAATASRVLRPARVPFVAHPWEWPFGAWKAAALATLEAQRLAVEHGMSLKDASAFNVQLVEGRAVLLDTTSFEVRRPGEPWTAYGQFCRHFLAPLALMAHVDPRLGQLLRVHLDGVPLDLAVRLLPRRARWRPSLALHLGLHARAQARRGADGRAPSGRVSERGAAGILASLASAVEGLAWEPRGTEWADYTTRTSYDEEGERHKRRIVWSFLRRVGPATVWDLGANAGDHSRVAASLGASVLAFDLDPAAVERCWRAGDARVTPLLLDLANPSPDLGWAHEERASWLARGPADCALALALVHHLAIGNNVPLPKVADLLARAGRHAIVEWVPKEDPQVARMLATRRDVFDGYTQDAFEAALAERFDLEDAVPVRSSARTLYLCAPKG